MKVLGQKNAYYIDLNKNVYRGYIETTLVSDPNERYVTYRSTHLDITKVSVVSLEKTCLPDFDEKNKEEKLIKNISSINGKEEKYAHKSEVKAQEIENIEYFSKDKTRAVKSGKCRIEIKSRNKNKAANSTVAGQVYSTPLSHSDNTRTDFCKSKPDSIKHLDDLGIADKDASLNLETCHDSFKFKIPENIGEYEDPETKRFIIRIEFSPKKSNPAILWYKPVNDRDKHKEVIALNGSSHIYNSSYIAPYIDTVTEMTMYYIIPNIEEIKVVSSGAFKAIKEEDKTIIYQYTAFSNPKYFMFAVGTYDQNDLFNDNDKKKVLTPILSGYDSKDKSAGFGSTSEGLSDVLTDIQAIIKYIENFTKTSELSTANIVFTLLNVDDLISKNMIVLKYSYVSTHRDVEMSFLLRRVLCNCLCFQTYGLLNWNSVDLWVVYGFSGYLADYCLRYLLGNNEFVYNYKQNKDFLIKNDVVEPPLFYTLRKDHEYSADFFKIKSKMVFHCMESHLSYAFLQKISDSVIETRTRNGFPLENDEDSPDSHKSFLEEQKKCFTQKFIRIVKDSTGKDLKSLFDFYVFRPGLLKIKIGLQIIKKKNLVKAVIAQTPTSLLPGAVKKSLNNVEIKSVELEGTFDHSLAPEIENVFAYHTRTKKKKKEDEDEEEDVMPLLYVLADPKRENLFDYFVEQPDYMHIEQLQEKCVMAQLEAIDSLSKKPTLATCEACERMLENSHVFYKVRIKIMKILKSMKIEGYENIYNSLESYGQNNCNDEYDGFQRLIQFFIRTRCVPNSTILKGNEFGLIQYFLQKHLVKNISYLDGDNLIKKSKIVMAFLENILKFNDNSMSQFEDSWYISAIINIYGLHCCLLTTFSETNLSKKEEDKQAMNDSYDEKIRDSFDDFFSAFRKERSKFTADTSETSIPVDSENIIKNCINEVERFRISDMVFPSNNNVITRACLISYIRLAFYKKVCISRCFLESLSEYPNLFSIRFVAIEGLLLLFPGTLSAVLRMILKETSFIVKNVLAILLEIISCFYKPEHCEYIKNMGEANSTDENIIAEDYNESKPKHYKSSNCDKDIALRIIEDLYFNRDILAEIFRIYFYDPDISYLINKVFACLENKFIKSSLYNDIVIKSYDFAKEEANRGSLLKTISANKTVKIVSFEELRIAVFEACHKIRIPSLRIKTKPKSVAKPEKPFDLRSPSLSRNKSCRYSSSKLYEETPEHLKITLKALDASTVPCLVKHYNNLIIRIKFPSKVIKLKRIDYPKILICKYRENPYVHEIDEFIKKTRGSSTFFSWLPLATSEILDKLEEDVMILNKPSAGNIKKQEKFKLSEEKLHDNIVYNYPFYEIEKSLIFCLSYTQSKLYSMSKTLFSLLEAIQFQYSFIPKTVVPMTPALKLSCLNFVKSLVENPNFNVFVYPVDLSILKNYPDIVRFPVCLQDILERLGEDSPETNQIGSHSGNKESQCISFMSFEAFITSLRRIPRNCLNYNDSKSEIAGCASVLKEKISSFAKLQELEAVSSIEVLKDIIAESKLSLDYFNFDSLDTWADLDLQLKDIKKKHSRYSSVGKMNSVSLNFIKQQLYNWFLNDSLRVQIFDD